VPVTGWLAPSGAPAGYQDSQAFGGVAVDRIRSARWHLGRAVGRRQGRGGPRDPSSRFAQGPALAAALGVPVNSTDRWAEPHRCAGGRQAGFADGEEAYHPGGGRRITSGGFGCTRRRPIGSGESGAS